MEAVAAEIDSEGWETLAVPAGDATAVTAEAGRTDRHGFSYVIPGDAAETFAEWFVPDGFERTEVYRASTPSHLFLLTVIRDPATERAILIAGVLERSALGDPERVARETGVTYSHVFRVDGTRLGTFRHDDPDPFFPA